MKAVLAHPRRLGAALTALAILLGPAMASGPTAYASACDPVATDAVQVVMSPVPVAATGSLAAGTSAPVTVTAVNSSGTCVSGATVHLYFSSPAGGSATTSTTACPYGKLTSNWETCTADANGVVPISYTAPSTLPNGGTDTIEATLQSSGPTAVSSSYTYASLSVRGQPLQAQEGAPFSGTVATFTVQGQLDTSTLTAAIDWGDGTSSAGTVIGTGTTTLTVTGTHTYAEESGSPPYVTNVTVSAPLGPSASAGDSAQVSDAPLAAAGTSLSGLAGHPLTAVTVATFTDADPAGTLADYSASINWGDGVVSSGNVTASGSGGYRVSGSHTYASRGTYTVTVTVADQGGATVTATGSAAIKGRR